MKRLCGFRTTNIIKCIISPAWFVRDETAVPTRRPDESDLLLLRELNEDARLSHRELARRTGISLATVNRRVRAMEDAGVIQGYHVRVDPEAVGWSLSVIVGLRIEKGHLREVQQRVAEDPRVVGVYDVTGDWDGFVMARLRDRRDLDDLAKTTLSQQHILRTNTMVVLDTVHEAPTVRLGLPVGL